MNIILLWFDIKGHDQHKVRNNLQTIFQNTKLIWRGAQDVSVICSVLNLTSMSMERFYAIVYPLKSRSVCTVSQVSRASILTCSCDSLIPGPESCWPRMAACVYPRSPKKLDSGRLFMALHALHWVFLSICKYVCSMYGCWLGIFSKLNLNLLDHMTQCSIESIWNWDLVHWRKSVSNWLHCGADVPKLSFGTSVIFLNNYLTTVYAFVVQTPLTAIFGSMKLWPCPCPLITYILIHQQE